MIRSKLWNELREWLFNWLLIESFQYLSFSVAMENYQIMSKNVILLLYLIINSSSLIPLSTREVEKSLRYDRNSVRTCNNATRILHICVNWLNIDRSRDSIGNVKEVEESRLFVHICKKKRKDLEESLWPDRNSSLPCSKKCIFTISFNLTNATILWWFMPHH